MAEGITGPGVDERAGFAWPERVPWTELERDFIDAWGHDEHGAVRAEHMEASGQSGGGKTYAIATMLQRRAARWDTGMLAILTKRSDDSIPLLGWPVVDSPEGLRKYRQAIYWPKTDLLGDEREDYHERNLYELLSGLWRPNADMVIYFDEVRYIEGLTGPRGRRARLKKLVRQYWREGRSHGISIVAGAQRPIGMVRDQHSESRWKAMFPPADEGDMDRFAELLGKPREWAPVLESLNQKQHEFVLRNSFTKDAYITWIDRKLRPLPSQVNQADTSRIPAAAPYGPATISSG
jgi:hypothetical protein